MQFFKQNNSRYSKGSSNKNRVIRSFKKAIAYRLIGLAVMACGPLVSGAQVITVKDADSGAPLEWVNIVSKQSGRTAVTNARGQANISAFSATDSLMIGCIGYRTELRLRADLSVQPVVALQPGNINLDEVVISASGFPQNAATLPMQIATISPRQAELENPQTTADLLSLSGKVFVQKSQQGGGSPMIRGFATNRLLYTVDGVRMNTAIFRSGNIQNVISLDPFALEQTEVLFGPGSVNYGSDAIGGVMRFQTLIPELSLADSAFVFGNAVMRYSTASRERTAHVDVNVGWKKWALLTSFSSWNFDNLRQGSHGPEDYVKPYYVQRIDSVDRVITQDDPLLQIPSAYSQFNLMQKIRFRPSEAWDLEYGFHYSETSPYGRYDRHNRMRNGLPRYAEWNYGPQKWMMNNLKVHHRIRHGIYNEATLHLAQQSFGESRIDRGFNKNIRSDRREAVDALSLNLDLRKSAGKRHTLYYGAEIISNYVKSTGEDTHIETGIGIPGPTRYPQSTWGTMGVYVSDAFEMSERVTLQGGLRYSRYRMESEFDTTFYPFPFTASENKSGALTGSIGAVWRPEGGWILRTNAGTAYRAPNVDDAGKLFDSEPGSVVVPNPTLEAEYAYNADLGVGKVFGDVFRIELTGYYTLLENAMVRRDYVFNGQDSILYDGTMSKVQAIQNAASAHVYGLQMGVELSLPSGFGLSADVNYQKGEEELDNGDTSPSRHAAPFFGVSRLYYRHEGLKLEFYSTFQAERNHDQLAVSERGKTEIYARDAQGLTYAPAWYTLNVKAEMQFTDWFRVSAGVENLTDQRYRPYSSGISAPGRNFIMAVYLEF